MGSAVGPLVVITAVLGAIGSPGPAWAGDERDAAVANALIREGNKHFRHEEYAAALEAFEQAYSVDPQTKTLLNLALAELRTNKSVEAAAHFRAYLAKPDAAQDSRTLVNTKWLPLAESQLARVQFVMPADAQVSIDGHPAKQDPSLGLFEVASGDHDVVVEGAGRREAFHITAPAGATLTMRALVDDANPPPSSTQNVAPDEPAPVAAPASSARVATVGSLGAGALAAVGVGIGFGLAATAKASAIQGGEGCMASAPTSLPCQHVNYDVSLEHREEWASIGGYVGAGVLGAASIATWFLWPRSPVRLAATAAPHEMGFGVTGRW